jgi:hypothetical protein
MLWNGLELLLIFFFVNEKKNDKKRKSEYKEYKIKYRIKR